MQGWGEEEGQVAGGAEKKTTAYFARAGSGQQRPKGADRFWRFLGHVGDWTEGKSWGGAARGRPGPRPASPVPGVLYGRAPQLPTSTGVGER